MREEDPPYDVEPLAFDTLSVEGFEVVEDCHVVAIFEERFGEVAASRVGQFTLAPL
ncbi:hypothetical protein [Halorubrum ezzemoulense]|uniref:hypothetical protein n=1 Tax=Halorubrum ezzemoulense TaxID=337243 RepID=UPI00142D92DA|nr:hypothetical protein [Halorubrum ezzemoulense]